MSAVPEIIVWKMRIAAKLISQPRPRPEQRWAQTQTIEQRQLQELIALRTECLRIPSSDVLARHRALAGAE